MYTVLLPIIILSLLLGQYLYQIKFRKYFGHLPSLPSLPFIGCMHLFIGDGTNLFKMLKKITAITKGKNLPLVAWVSFWPWIVLDDIEDCKIVSSSCIEKPSIYNFGKIWLGDGLLIGPGEVWKRNIKKLGGSFTRGMVDGFQDIFNKQARKLVQNLKSTSAEANGYPFDAMNCVSLVAFETVCHTALGAEDIFNTLPVQQFYDAFNNILESFIHRGCNILYHPDFTYKWTSQYKEAMKNIATFNKVSDKVIENRKLKRKLAKKINTSPVSDSNIKQKLYIDLLLDLNEADPNSFTEDQIRSEINTIILAAQETSALTLITIMLMLGSRPKIQGKLFEEMLSIFGRSKRDVTKDDLGRMIYCEAVINETLRLMPPVPAVLRMADKQVELKSCTIPKGTVCVLNFWSAGRSKKIYGEDAEYFKPERWITETKLPHTAFSVGKRTCIGKQYAMPSLKTVVSHCVRELIFFSEAENLNFKVDCTLKPVSGHFLQVHLR